jgi:hypothetical protein
MQAHLTDAPVANSWLSAAEWARLYRCTRPTKMQQSAFELAAQSGNLDELRADVIHKICRELKHIMTEHGWLEEVRLLSNCTRKSDGVQLIRQGVSMSVEAKAAAVSQQQQGVSSPAPPLSPAATPAATTSVERLLATALTTKQHNMAISDVMPLRPASEPQLELEDDMGLMSSPKPALSSSSNVVPRNALQPWSTVPAAHGRGGASGTRGSTLKSSVEAAAAALSSSLELPTLPYGRISRTVVAPKPVAAVGNACPSALASSIPKPLPPLQTAFATPSELEMYSSPMAKVIVILKRFQLRMGSYPVRFEIPNQYLADIAARRLRVHVVPMVANQPSVWPKIKEVFVFINERNVQTSWKRAWPARKSMDVTKAYLPLDVTQYLLNPLHQIQRLQLDCFNHEFCGSFSVVLVAPRAEMDVMAEWRDQLTRGVDELRPFYESMMRIDNAAGDDDDVTCEVPTVALKCPIAQTRIVVPVRGRHCRHLQCLDFAAFLRYCHISCYWNCPLCDATMRLRDVIVDGPFYEMLQKPASAGWTHAQLVMDDAKRHSGSHAFWAQSEKHKSNAVDLSSSDDDHEEAEDERHDDHDDPPQPQRRRRRMEDMDGNIAVKGLDASGSAAEPICL